MKQFLMCSAAIVAVAAPGAAFAQSTGSTDFEDAIVVTGSRLDQGVGGVKIPDSPKAKVVIGQEIIQAQRPGQTINEIINLVPGVSFTNNDPWGSSGGSFTIRGFGSDRISQTFDGIPLNDSGNYAVYTNQQVDSELIENVNVNLGSTDVDSPTAAAVGGTVNIKTLEPSDEMGALATVSYGNIAASGAGDRPFTRMFGMLQTGDLTGHGTKAWISASRARNDAVYANYGRVEKQQYNAKIWQDIGDNGDFISIAAHYNENRNTFNGSPLRASAFTGDKSGRFYDISNGANCQTSTTGIPNGCGSDFERRYNPSNTGNIRGNAKFTLADGLTLSFDGAYQWVKANGGGTSVASEGSNADGYSGVIFGLEPTVSSSRAAYYYFGGVDLNGDGDTTDFVRVLSPSQTNTRRWVGIANLAYEIDPSNRVRLSYSYDRARHRQTGYAGYLERSGEPDDVFPINDPILNADGEGVQKRNRLSFATLHQIAGEYSGRFFEDKLTVLLGLRAPFFKRDLNQYCITTDTTGNVNCIADGQVADYLAANPNYAGPQSRTAKYDKLLPNVGATFKITPALSIAASYAKNLSVPSTDALYSTFLFDDGSDEAFRAPETSDSFDLSLRYTSAKVQAAVTGWYSKYKNRLVTAVDIDGNSTDTNLGPVKKYGIDASISYSPIKEVTAYLFGSYIKSEIQNDAVTGSCALDSDLELADLCYNVTTGTGEGATTVSYVRTSGKRERGAPKYLFGGRLQGNLGDFTLGVQAKKTSSRYFNDLNGEIQTATTSTGATRIIAPGAKFGAYTIVDLDLRYSLASLGMEKGAIQLNVTNLFDKFYVGSFSGGFNTLASSSSGFVNFGSPRAISATLMIGF